MKFPDYRLTEQEVGDLEIIGEDGGIDVDLYAYLRTQLFAAQMQFIEATALSPHVGCFLDGLNDWSQRLVRHRPDLACRLQVVTEILKVIFAFDAKEAANHLPRGVILRDTWEPIVRATIVSLRHDIRLPFMLGSLSLGIRDAFIARDVN